MRTDASIASFSAVAVIAESLKLGFVCKRQDFSQIRQAGSPTLTIVDFGPVSGSIIIDVVNREEHGIDFTTAHTDIPINSQELGANFGVILLAVVPDVLFVTGAIFGVLLMTLSWVGFTQFTPSSYNLLVILSAIF